MRKRRRKTRREPPPRLEERLTVLELAATELERQLSLENRAKAPEVSTGDELADPIAVVGEQTRERSFRPHAVAEAEVLIIHRDRAPSARQREPAAAEPPCAPVPTAAAPNLPPASGAEGTARPLFNGTVEEATVVIIRHTPRQSPA